MRAGSALRDRADSIELVIVSTLAAEELSAATDSIRSLWNGRARVVRLESPIDTGVASTPLSMRGAATDPLEVTVSLARRLVKSGAVIRRAQEPPADRAGATGNAVSIEWPLSGRPRGAVPRASVDTIGGVVADGKIVVAPFERRWAYAADSLLGAGVVARWIDGDPAVVEWRSNDGCIRSAAIPVTSAGDLVIRDDFVRFVAAVSGECSGKSMVPASVESVAALAGRGSLATSASFRPRSDVRSTLSPWLFALAIALALAEILVRRRSSAAPARKVATESEQAVGAAA
jgi:hypothetical protein